MGASSGKSFSRFNSAQRSAGIGVSIKRTLASTSSGRTAPGTIAHTAGWASGNCTAAAASWRLDKGYAWWDGDMRSGLYNHFLTPNSRLADCWQTNPPHDPAIKAARGNHPGGVGLVI